MTAVDLDALDAARAAATGGVWKLWGMDVLADQDGTSNVDTAVPVAHTSYRDENGKPRTWDADLICEMHAALPDLIADARKLRALRDAIEGLADDYDGDFEVHGSAVAEDIRATVAAALGEDR